MRVEIDQRTVAVEASDSLLVNLLRHGIHPTGGGCLCLTGDCPHCVVSVDGVGYVRSCQTMPREGMRVERRHHAGSRPPLIDHPSLGPPPPRTRPVPNRHLYCDVVVVGQGASGRDEAAAARAAGKQVVTLDAGDGQEVVGIYPGPLVVARTPEGKLQVHPREEIVVATGAAEIQPVVPGSRLDGLVTARAAAALAASGIELGRLLAVGSAPPGLGAEVVEGELVRFEGDDRVRAVVMRDGAGQERHHRCDTVSLGLGYQPRDALLRMARGLPARAVGGAARPSDIPPCPTSGTICPCAAVTLADLASVWERGFHELELVKRATLAGTGTCQGSICIPYLRSFLAARGGELQPPFTARPVNRQLTLAEVAAGSHDRPTPRTPLHREHLALGARMDRTGGWWRPWSYGEPEAEYRAVREAVSIGDVSPLGKFRLSGPDALELLELLYPTHIATLEPGRSRYALLLDERGYVLDDGLVCRDGDDRYTITLTSAGSSFGEAWFRDWIDARGFDVRLLNQTFSLGAINVTGPRAAELLSRAGVTTLPAFAAHSTIAVAGIDCRIYRLSFTGELSYELHHAAADSAILWRRLLDLGADLGIHPHGMKALLDLRLEKGHIVVGKDTDFDSTPRRLDHGWAVKLDKPEFVGRGAVLRTDRQPLDRRLVGLEMDPPAPIDGAVIHHGSRYAGYVTSSALSPALGKAVLLGWLRLFDGELPSEVTVDGRPARRVETPFYDPEGERARTAVALGPAAEADGGSFHSPEPIRTSSSAGGRHLRNVEAIRVVASPAALDGCRWPSETTVLRLAADEALALTDRPATDLDDPYAIVERETGFAVARLDWAEAARILEHECRWEPPRRRPALAQGAVAEIPVHLWLEQDRVLLVTRSAFAAELEERLW